MGLTSFSLRKKSGSFKNYSLATEENALRLEELLSSGKTPHSVNGSEESLKELQTLPQFSGYKIEKVEPQHGQTFRPFYSLRVPRFEGLEVSRFLPKKTKKS